jgi:predicted AlkP superfamily pyrophosphatase or phosphodiesterase
MEFKRAKINTIILTVILLLLNLNWHLQAKSSISVPVVLISIDGLKPDYILEANKHNLKIPNLRRLALEGTYATSVKGVLPTVTYPSHTTMVTGVSPAKHGILANTPFDPWRKNMEGWYWYAEDIKVSTLWDVATQAGLVTASVDWPVTVGANITYNIAQYWRASTPDDLKLIRAVSTKGLLVEAEKELGSYPEGNDYTLKGDQQRARFNIYILEKKRPQFLTCYFGALDTEEHISGPYSRETFAILEEIDVMVGKVRAAAEKIGDGRAVICVVSDHGFLRTDKEININSALREAGLIELNEAGNVKSWEAYAWYSGGVDAVMQRNPADEAMRQKIRDLLKRLANNPENGIYKLLDESEVQNQAGFVGAAFVLCAKPGFRFGRNLQGPVIVNGKPGGTHGYLPEIREMDSSFFIVGPGIAPGHELGQVDMRDIAPTLAARLGVALPLAEGHDLLKR